MDARQMYNKWLKDFADDQALVEELNAIAGDEKEIEDRFYRGLEFGTAGMRGVIGYGTNRMNVYNVRRATQGLAQFIHKVEGGAECGVAIAYDSRRFSPEFALEAAKVLCANGVKVYLYESLRPVPVLSFTLRHLGCIAGIVITASHNPKQYNGYKVYWQDGGQLPPDRAAQVLECINALDYTDAKVMCPEEAKKAGLLTMIGKEVDDVYISRVRSLCVQPELCAEMGKTMKIVYSPLNGSGNVPVRRILKEVGFENVYVVSEQELPDPNFTTVGAAPNPENYSAFDLARELAVKVDADVIFATDPDCDRLGCLVRAADGSFIVLTGNQIGCLLMHYVLSGRKAAGTLPSNGAVVKSIVSTDMARAIASSFGVTTFNVLTGFKFIAEKIQQFEDTGSHEFLFGFEESYGFLAGTFVRDKDAVIASMLLAEAAAWYKKQGMTLYEGLMNLYKTYGYYSEKVTSFALEGKDGLAKMVELMANLRANTPADFAGVAVKAVLDYKKGTRTEGDAVTKLDYPTSDVLFYELDGGAWVCIRPSGTEPKVKVYVNAVTDDKEKSAALTQNLLDAAVAIMNKNM